MKCYERKEQRLPMCNKRVDLPVRMGGCLFVTMFICWTTPYSLNLSLNQSLSYLQKARGGITAVMNN